MNKHKLFRKILSGSKNIRFEEFAALVEAFGFRPAGANQRQSLHIRASASTGLVNLQNFKGKAKPYQIRQFLELVEQHNLSIGGNE
jgi:hypothetical protein